MKRFFFNEFNVKLVFIVATILYCIPPLMVKMDTCINGIVLWAAVVTAMDLVKRRDILRTHSALLGYLFLACFVCTIFFNSFASVNVKLWIYMFLQLCFFTYFDSGKSREEILNELKQISKVITGLTLVLNLISLFLFFTGYCEVFTNSVMSTELIMGRHPNSSLYGIMANSNWTSFLELTNIGLLCFKGRIEGRMRAREILTLALCAAVLFLTNSRGGLIGLLVFIMADRGIGVLSWLREKRKKAGMCLLALPVLLALSLAGNSAVKAVSGEIYGFTRAMKTTVSHADNPAEKSKSQVKTGENKKASPKVSIKRDETERDGSTSVRLELWKAGIEVIQENSPVGLGGERLGEHVYEKLSENTQVDSLSLAANTHNIFIQTALTAGVAGMLCLLAYIIRDLLYGALYLFRCHAEENVKDAVTALISLLAGYLVINLVEADIFMSRNFMSCLFWILLGYMTRIVQLSVKVRGDKNETYIHHTCTLE